MTHKKKYLYRVLPYMGAEFYRCTVFNQCACNELASLRGRHMIRKMTPVKPWILDQLYLTAAKHFTDKLDPISLQQVVAKKTSGKRRRYQTALDKYLIEGYQERDSHVKAFVKVEKWPLIKPNGLGLEDLDYGEPIEAQIPRLIQFRSYKYCLLFGSFIVRMEDYLFKEFQPKGCDNPFAKGLNSIQRAAKLVKMERWSRTVWILLDASKWDAHIDEHYQQLKDYVYELMFNHPALLMRLLDDRLNNVCETSKKILYTCIARLMSGDGDTSCGNCLVNFLILDTWMLICGISEYEFAIDGDDSVVALSEDEFHKLNFKFLDDFGFLFKYQIVHNIYDVDFCQSKIIEVRPGVHRSIRCPIRTISRACYATRNWAGSILWYLWSLGMCELSLNDGVPVLQSFAMMLIRIGSPKSGYKLHGGLEDSLQYRVRKEGVKIGRVFPKEITPCARTTFALAFNVPVAKQLELENRFNNMVAK